VAAVLDGLLQIPPGLPEGLDGGYAREEPKSSLGESAPPVCGPWSGSRPWSGSSFRCSLAQPWRHLPGGGGVG